MGSAFFNMTSLVLHLAKANNLTLCSTTTKPAQNSTILYFDWTITFIALGLLYILILKDEKQLAALKAKNTALLRHRQRFHRQVVQLFGEKMKLQHILLGHDGMGRSLRVTIDGETVSVRIDPVDAVEEADNGQRLLLLQEGNADAVGTDKSVRCSEEDNVADREGSEDDEWVGIHHVDVAN